MKIGYPCINNSIGCTPSKTFRLKSYSESRFVDAVENNLECLLHILCYNVSRDILCFRIGSDLIPFASHSACKVNWRKRFKASLQAIGKFIRDQGIRISMHPDQFVLINSPDKVILKRSIKDLVYHAELLDLMELDYTAKIQIHVGGVYSDKEASRERFIARYDELPKQIKRRLVIENDDKLYCLRDCMTISESTGVPVLFDVFHHRLNNCHENLIQAFDMFTKSWSSRDGEPMVDYSAQQPGARRGANAETINVLQFKNFLNESQPYNFDLMLEVKDKERSAKRAVQLAYLDPRFVPLED